MEYTHRRPASLLIWLGLPTALGFLAPIFALWGGESEPAMWIAFPVGGATVGGGVALVVLGLLRPGGRDGPTLGLEGDRVRWDGEEVDLGRPHRAIVRAGSVLLLELSREPEGDPLRIPLPRGLSAPPGWFVRRCTYRPDGLEYAGFRSKALRSLGDELMRRLAVHQEHNVLFQRTRFLPTAAEGGAMVEHVVVETIGAPEGPGRGAFRSGAGPDDDAVGAAAVLEAARFYDERLGLTPEWVVLREGGRVTLFPVGYTYLGRGADDQPRLESRGADGSPFHQPIAMDDAEVLEILRGWLAEAVSARRRRR